MPYVDSNEIESFLASDYDTEGWERDSGEAFPKYVRSHRRVPAVPRPLPPRPVGGVAAGVVRTPAGRAEFQFPKPVATKEAVDSTVRELKTEIKATSDAIKRIDDTLDKNTAILDRKIAALEASAKQAQQAMLLPMLLSKPPSEGTLTVAPPAAGAALPGGLAVGDVIPVKTKFAQQDNMFLLIALMSMGGGGLGGSGDSSNMLLMALALGGLGKTS